jgi:hypothetical protein
MSGAHANETVVAEPPARDQWVLPTSRLRSRPMTGASQLHALYCSAPILRCDAIVGLGPRLYVRASMCTRRYLPSLFGAWAPLTSEVSSDPPHPFGSRPESRKGR